MNGWQTAYGYDDGRSRETFVASAERDRGAAGRAPSASSPRRASARCSRELGGAFDAFMALDEEAWTALQDGRPEETKRILLGPELEHFETMASAAGDAGRRAGGSAASAAATGFDARARHAQRELVAVAIGAGVVIVLLLLTVQDVVRLALERRDDGTRLDARRHPHASACCWPPASRRGCWPTSLRVPEIVLLIAFGALLGPSALDVVDVPLDSLGAQLLFTFGVSSILFYGGLNLSLTVLRGVAVSLGLLAIPGVILTALAHRRRRVARVRAAVRAGPADRRGAVADRPGDPDPAVRRLAAARAGRADRDRRVRVQRPDRRGARARGGRSAAERRRRHRRPGVGLPRRAGDQLGRRRSSPACCCRPRSPAAAPASCATRRRSPCSRSSR